MQLIYLWFFQSQFVLINIKQLPKRGMNHLLYEYMISGVVDSQFRHFGGEDCYQEIPFYYQLTVCIVYSAIFAIAIKKWGSTMVQKSKKIGRLVPNSLEKVCFGVGVVCLIYTFYRKVVRKEGIFMLNPCHITFLMLLILLVGDNASYKMRWLHTAWTGWLFGGFAALVIPHLQGLSWLEAVTFFAEHLLIWPFGPLLLNRRYGYLKPTLANNMPAYGTMLFFHILILVPVCRLTKANVNFQLCHSPAEPLYPTFGYHYYTLEIINLAIICLIIRWVSYFSCRLLPEPKYEEIKEE